jgi:hypothetical protein
MTAPIKLPPNPTELIGTVRTLQDAVEVFRLMKDRLGLTYEFIDDVSGLTKGHADKVLSRTEIKRLGYDSFAVFAKLFALEFRVYVDMESVKEMEAVWEGRKRPLFPNGKPGRVSKKLIELAKPHVFRAMGKKSAAARMLCSTVQQRIKIAKKAGRKSSRLSKLTPERRKTIAKKAAEARWRPVVLLEPAK